MHLHLKKQSKFIRVENVEKGETSNNEQLLVLSCIDALRLYGPLQFMSAIKYCDTAKQLSNQEDKQSLTKQK